MMLLGISALLLSLAFFAFRTGEEDWAFLSLAFSFVFLWLQVAITQFKRELGEMVDRAWKKSVDKVFGPERHVS